jgi:flagellar basal-body rod protein FlgB
MVRDILADPASAALSKSLEGTSARQQAIAKNLANVETPGYLRQDVSFLDSLQSALDTSGSDHERAQRIAAVEPFTMTDPSRPPKADGNSVDIDFEMAELAKNNLRFESSATALSLKIRMLRTAINEGRR